MQMDYIVKDIDLADYGRKELTIAETEMPGLMACREEFGTTKPLLMIPACFLGGSVFCLFCDLLARTWMAPTELGISTVTAIFGAPVVLWIMVSKSRRERG